MNRFFPLIILVVVGLTASFLLAGPSGSDAERLWRHITLESPYKSWKLLPQESTAGVTSAQKAPYGSRYRVYINEKGLNGDPPPYPEGTIIVREAHDDQARLQSVTVKRKVGGFNPGGGDWYWAIYYPSGDVRQAGKVKGCIGCHSSAAENDYLLSGDIR